MNHYKLTVSDKLETFTINHLDYELLEELAIKLNRLFYPDSILLEREFLKAIYDDNGEFLSHKLIDHEIMLNIK